MDPAIDAGMDDVEVWSYTVENGSILHIYRPGYTNPSVIRESTLTKQ
jgi:hypothetical protein